MDKIWNNPLMWQQSKKSGNKPEIDFNFDIELDIDKDDLSKLENDFSLVDSAVKAGEYKETTPQVGELPKGKELLEQGKAKQDLDKEDKDYLLKKIFNELPLKDLPALNALMNSDNKVNLNINVKFDIFDNDDEEANAAISEKMGVDTASIYDMGKKIGLSSLDIVDNIDTLRSSATIKKITAGLLDEQDLKQLYVASMNDDTQKASDILDNKNIVLGKDITINDVMNLAGTANKEDFRKIYFSNE